MLLEQGISSFEEKIISDSLFLQAYRASYHSWLETQEDQNTFIADGTAGQFDVTYAQGFYGFLSEAPPYLQTIHRSAKHDLSS